MTGLLTFSINFNFIHNRIPFMSEVSKPHQTLKDYVSSKQLIWGYDNSSHDCSPMVTFLHEN